MKRILVIDDDHEGSSILLITLEKKGYECEHAFLDERILDYVKKFMPDIIIIDVYPENKAGSDLLKKLKKMEEISHIPIYPFFSKRLESSLILQGGSDRHIMSDELLSLIKTNLLKNKN